MTLIYKDNKYFLTDEIHIRSEILTESFGPHYHDFVELVYISKGKATHFIDGVEYPVSHGDMLLVNYNQTHSFFRNSSGISSEYINILVKPEFISSSLSQPENAFSLLRLSEFSEFQTIVHPNNCVVSFTPKERSFLEPLLFQLQEELSAKSPGWEMTVRSGLNLLFISLFRKMALPMQSEKKGISNELLTYLSHHCHEKLTLQTIAKQLHYHPAYFSRLFRSATGMTLTEYIRQERIRKACYSLEHSNQKIKEICQATGYTDSTKFFADFKDLMQVTPLQYRKKFSSSLP